MSFTTKQWKDRISEYPTRRTLTDTKSSAVSTVTVAREEGTISQAGDAFSAANMNDLENRVGIEFSTINSNMAGIKTYVGEDKLLHFVDSTGADSALNFSSIKIRHLVTCSSSGEYGTWYTYMKLLPSPEVNICSVRYTVRNYSHPANVNIGLILFVSRNDSSGFWTLKNRLNYPLTVTPSGGTAFTVAAGAYFTNFGDSAVFTAEYISQNLDELRDICTSTDDLIQSTM